MTTAVLRFTCTKEALAAFENLLPNRVLRNWYDDSPAVTTTRVFNWGRLDTHVHNIVRVVEDGAESAPGDAVTDPEIAITMMAQGDGTERQLRKKVMARLRDADIPDAPAVSVADRLGLTEAQVARMKARIAPGKTDAQFRAMLRRRGKLIADGIVWHNNVTAPVLVFAGVVEAE